MSTTVRRTRAEAPGKPTPAPPALAPNPFHAWLAQPPGTLSDGFELTI